MISPVGLTIVWLDSMTVSSPVPLKTVNWPRVFDVT